MSVALPIVAVVALAGFSVLAAVLTSIAAGHPERAATVVVVASAGAAATFVVLQLFALGVTGMEGGVEGARGAAPAARHGRVDHDPARVVLGLGTAAVLAATAGLLVHTGDWTRVDGEDGAGPGAA